MESIATTILAPVIRHGLTTLGGALVAVGALEASQQGNFVAITTGLVTFAIGMGWSLVKNSKKK